MGLIRTGNKRAGRKRLAPTLACFRSSNGTALHHDVDGRSATMRRLRDIIHTHTADLGGTDTLSEGQRAILRRAALLQLQLEMMEQKFAQREDNSATGKEIEVYQRASDALRRLLESLGLHEGRKVRAINTIDMDRLIEAVRVSP
jgi:hypothetical protein